MAVPAREQSPVVLVRLNRPELTDRCGFGPSFDQNTVECPAFQPHPFVAATSYGKPLGTHIACAHLQVGEFGPNQFYPRCALGSERERVRWIAMVGRGKIELQRALQAEFEALNADFRRRLIDAKAALLGAAPARAELAQDALAATVREFLVDFDSFVGAHAARIAELGVSPAMVTATAARVLAEWQRSKRLDLPVADSTWMGRPVPLEPTPGENVLRAESSLVKRRASVGDTGSREAST